MNLNLNDLDNASFDCVVCGRKTDCFGVVICGACVAVALTEPMKCVSCGLEVTRDELNTYMDTDADEGICVKCVSRPRTLPEQGAAIAA